MGHFENAIEIPSDTFRDYAFEYKGLYFNKPRFSRQTAFHKGIPGAYVCHVRTKNLNTQELLQLRDELEKEVKEEIKC